MKLAILADGVYPFVMGGMQRHSSNVAKYMAMKGHDVTLIHAVPAKTKTLPTEEEVRETLQIPAGSSFRSVVMRFPESGWLPGHYLKESYQLSRSMYDRMKDEWAHFDFIYAKGFCAWHLLHVKSRGMKLPPVGVKFHGYEMFQKDADFKSKLQSWMLRGPVRWNNQNADVVFSYGGHITEIIKQIGVKPDRIEEVSGAIDISWLRKENSKANGDPRRFVFIGRNERRKGIEELHKAIEELSRTENFEFHFIGPIPNSVRLKNDRVVYHGSLSETDKIMAVLDTSDVLVVPSYSEGMPNVILEGMSRGLAIIATDVGAVNIEVDSSCGWLIEAGDESQLAGALKSAIHCADSELLAKKDAARKKVGDRFLWPDVAMKLENAIQRRLKV